MSTDTTQFLQWAQLLDATFPIGATAHSFGLETLTAEGALTTPQLASFLQDYLSEIGVQEGLFCRAAHRLVTSPPDSFEIEWLHLNQRLSAFKLAREPRKASATLGKRFLQMVCALQEAPLLERAYALALDASMDIHHATAFGLVGGWIGIDEELVAATYLHQTTLSLVSVSQRLLPLGQVQAAQILWDLKPHILTAARKSVDGDLESPASSCFPGLVEIAGMRHPALPIRLFIS